MWDDSFMESPLSKSLSKEVKTLGSAKILMNYLFSQKLTLKSRTIIMRILLKVLSLDVGYKPFKNFESIFHIFDEEGDQKFPDRVGFFLPIDTRQLQKYSEDDQKLTEL